MRLAQVVVFRVLPRNLGTALDFIFLRWTDWHWLWLIVRGPWSSLPMNDVYRNGNRETVKLLFIHAGETAFHSCSEALIDALSVRNRLGIASPRLRL